MAELPEALQPEALKRFAASPHLNTSERDLLRVLRDVGLSEKLPVQSFIVGAIRVRSIALKSWFRYLLNVRNGGQLFGGFSPWDGFASLCLKSFWEAFRKERPQHAVFELHNAHLHRCIPYCIHLDEGRGLRKSAVLVIHFQSIFGADTAPNFRADFAFSWQDHLGQEEASEIMLRNQFHNARGSTFFSRMLYTILPKASYTKRNSNVFTAVLENLREECTEMLEDGFLLDDGCKYYGALIAIKGDAPALVKAGNFTRNFQCLGNPICWECMAGSPHVPFEDCSRNPIYESTIHAERPWQVPAPLSQVPGVPGIPELVYQRDAFHIYKQSIGGSFAASTIVLLAELGYWNAAHNTFAETMDRAYEDFSHYVKNEFRGPCVPFMKHFTRTNLHYPRTNSFPYARPKGGDVMLLTRWLKHLVLHGPFLGGARSGNMCNNVLEAWHAPVMAEIERAASGALDFFRLLHNNGLWLPRDLAHMMGEGAFQFCNSYTALARMCYNQGLTRFSLVPSLHYFHHFYVEIKQKLNNPHAMFVLSPSIANCEADEDFIGKVAQISRHVHPGVTNARSIDRYLVKLHFAYAGED